MNTFSPHHQGRGQRPVLLLVAGLPQGALDSNLQIRLQKVMMERRPGNDRVRFVVSLR